MADKRRKAEETRLRMLDAASRSFRSHGFAGVGVDGIAKAAGATSGAFYAHLSSKEEAFRIAVERGLDEVIEGIRSFRRDNGAHWVKAFADYYLSRAHRVDLSCGCAMTTLSPEVVRATPDLRATYTAKMAVIVDLIADGLEGRSAHARRRRAWAMLGTLIGGLTLARAVASEEAVEEIAAAAKEAAIDAAGDVRDDLTAGAADTADAPDSR